MAGNVKQSMLQTAQDFQNHIAPVFRQLYKGCVLVHTETFEDELSKAFDNNAGIDVWLINNEHATPLGIASRIQRSDKNWRTFTIRRQRDNGSPTEFVKRTQALELGNLFPALTYQAYISKDGKKLLGMAIAHTWQLFDYIKYCKDIETNHTGQNQFGQASFYVISWRDFARYYDLTEYAPDAKDVIRRIEHHEQSLFKW